MDETSHHGHLPTLAMVLSRLLVSSLNWLKTSLEVSLHSESCTLSLPSLLWLLHISSPHGILPEDTRAGTEGFSC